MPRRARRAPRVVALYAADGDDAVRAGRLGLGHKEFKLADLFCLVFVWAQVWLSAAGALPERAGRRQRAPGGGLPPGLRTLLPLISIPERSSRLMYSSTPGGAPGTPHLWMGVGSRPRW